MAQRILNDENINALLSMAAGALTSPRQRAELIERLEGVREDIHANGDADAIAFMNGLCHVAINGPSAIPDVDVPAAYRRPWDALIIHLQRAELPPEQDVFTTIRKNTILVMTETPEHKQAWFDNIARNLEQAEEQGDTQMITLLTAVQTLLLDGSAPAVPPQLEGEYQACWQAIVGGLA